jgi:DNA-binding NtrC family response regulator
MRTTALVIDDEASIRKLVQQMLEPEVCRVLEAGDGESGLRLIERANPPVDVVLTDWVMPGLHGLDVVEVLHEYRPNLPVVVISGYTSTIHPIVRHGSRLHILEKPFTVYAVQSAVAAMIARAVRARTHAHDMRERAARARDRNAVLREHAAVTRTQVDLVEAAWAMHNARQNHRDRVPQGPDIEERL